MRRLLRVFAHVHYTHAHKLRHLGLEKSFNHIFKYLILFLLEFKLTNKRDLEPIQNFVDQIINEKNCI